MFGSSARLGSMAYRDVAAFSNLGEDKAQWVVALLQGCIDQIDIALGALEQKQIAVRCTAIAQASRILDEGLRPWLDTENGGELAANLELLYAFCILDLSEANASADPRKLNNVKAVIAELLEGWRGLVSQRKVSAGSAALQAA